jgi:hypothetical protein
LKFTNQTPSVGMRTWSHKHDIISCYTWFLVKGKTQGHGFYQNKELGLNVDQILVKPTIDVLSSLQHRVSYYYYFFHDPSGYPLSIMGNNESECFEKWNTKGVGIMFFKKLFFLEDFFNAVKCHYKSFPSNTLCFWHIISVSVNLPKMSTTTSHQK